MQDYSDNLSGNINNTDKTVPQEIELQITGDDDKSLKNIYYHQLHNAISLLESSNIDLSNKSEALLKVFRELEESRRKTEENEKTFRYLFDNANYGLAVVNIQSYEILICNKIFNDIFFINGFEKQPASLKDLFLHDDFEAFETILKSNSGQHTIRFEFSVLRRDGSDYYAEFNFSIIQYKKQDAYLLTVTNLNDIKEAQNEIKSYRDWLAAIIKSVPLPLFIEDTLGTYLLINPAYSKFFGLSPSKTIGLKNPDVFPKTDADFFVEKDLEVVRNGSLQIFPYRLENCNHEMRDVVFTKSCFHTANGAVGGIVGTITDLTEIKKTEAALREIENRFKDFALLLPQTVFEINMMGELTYSNYNGYLMFGFNPLEHDDKISVFNCFKKSELQKLNDNLLIATNEQNVRGTEYIAKKVDGTEFPVMLFSSPIIHNSECIGFRGIIIDMTDRKSYEEKLKESEVKFQSIFENMTEACILYEAITDGESNKTIDYKIIEVNKVFVDKVASFVGLNKNELIGIKLSELPKLHVRENTSLIWNNIADISKIIKEIDNGNSSISFEAVYPDYNYPTLFFNVKAFKTENNRIAVILEDILSRKKNENAIINMAKGFSGQTGEEFFKSLVVYLTKTLGANIAFIAQLEQDNPNYMVTIANCIDGQIADNVKYPIENNPCQNVLNNEIAVYTNNLGDLYKNSIVFNKLNMQSYAGTLLKSTQNKILGIMGVMSKTPIKSVDFTKSILSIFAIRAAAELERIQSTVELRESEEKLRSIYEASIDIAFVVVNLNNDDIDEISEFSPGAENTFGYTRQDIIGHSVAALFPMNTTKKLDIDLNNSIKSQTTYYREQYFQRKNGETFPAILTTHPLKTNKPDNRSVLAVIFDITRQKHAELEIQKLNDELELMVEQRTDELNSALLNLEKSNTELIQLNESVAKESNKLLILNDQLAENQHKLKIANETKDKFLSIIAHDLKNPLNAIITVSDILVNYSQAMDKNAVVHQAEQIHKLSYQLNALLDNLLTWSRTQSGRIILSIEEFNIISVLNSIETLFYENLNQKKISLLFRKDTDIIIRADKNLIETVLRNLISNAIKFTPPGGVIQVLCKRLERMWEFTVQDDGIGISKEDIEKLFRIDVSHTTIGTSKEKGTGLGLIICKEFIEMHHGNLSVKSIVNKGSAFIFTIPDKLQD